MKVKLTVAFISLFLLTGLTQVGSSYVWTFFTDQSWPTGYNQSTGTPDQITNVVGSYPSVFFDRINNALPESEVNELFLVDDSQSNIHLEEEAEVFITFLHEGAGYKNSFGYFTYDSEAPPTTTSEVNEIIVFANLSYPYMAAGDRVSIGTFPAGTSIGFFLAANGFTTSTGVKTYSVPYYYTLQILNPEPTEILRRHTVLLYDDEVEEVVLGIEDLNRQSGDNDFNDAVFSIAANPSSAITTSSIIDIPSVDDSDGDGVIDSNDEYPNDNQKAINYYYPSASDWVTYAFEDLWPSVGDYDMNDLVVYIRNHHILNSNNDITQIRMIGEIQARGASRHNALAIHLQGINPNLIDSTTLAIDDSNVSILPESGQTDVVIVLFEDAYDYTNTGGSGSCVHFNTVPSCPQNPAVEFELTIDLIEPIEPFAVDQYDLFIFQENKRGKEIHLLDYAPTDLFDSSYIGKQDDATDPALGQYFRTEQNLPWALRIPTRWEHPQEYIDITWAYPDYQQWAESNGSQSTTWYLNNRGTHHVITQ
ncbi:MAG: hypothetical protein COB04_05815 [Gammaproteobacteria bacterium]|nr:MAG: hypothetical protein COB04_05815 [Gammaproteobacteria bacterium]